MTMTDELDRLLGKVAVQVAKLAPELRYDRCTAIARTGDA